VYEIKSAMTRR